MLTLCWSGQAAAEQSVDAQFIDVAAAARLWYALGALMAFMTFGAASILWVLDTSSTLGLGVHMEPLVHWLTLCSPALVISCMWMLMQTHGKRAPSKLHAKPLLSAEQLLMFKDECAKVERVNQELLSLTEDDQQSLVRFAGDSHEMLTGQPDDAVRGLEHLMGVSENLLRSRMVEGMDAILREVEELGVPELSSALHNILSCDGVETSVAALVAHQRSVLAGLHKPHIVAIRLYTCSSGFRHFNDPLRDRHRIIPHPLPATTAFLAEGIRKLRLLYEQEHDAHETMQGSQGELILFRGLHNMTLADGFIANCMGGTELAVCSTTSSFRVAVSFMLQSPSGLPIVPTDVLLLQLVVRNCNRYGGAIDYLSVNPTESEVVYPPLTFLEPTGNYQIEQVGGTRLTVIEVVPTV